jgi:pimeloyl-ACP methyl ester carboxylesterase
MTQFTPVHHQIKAGAWTLHGIEAGSEHPDSLVFVHGWPEDWTEWQPIMTLASASYRVIAMDLPGIGGSGGAGHSGEKAAIAETIHAAVRALGIKRHVIIGHDAGAMVAYAYLRRFAAELDAAVLISSVIPGLAPWSKIVANPHMWHFAFHNTPGLPETLVIGRHRAYFDYFFELLTHNHAAITDTARDHYASAYASAGALTAGFDWYRAFASDAKLNGRDKTKITTPLLYLRGAADNGDINDYLAGFHEAGIGSVTTALIPDSGHFTPEENPAAVWSEISGFLGNPRARSAS